MQTFIILGYGVPKDIMSDNNYNRYLSAVFNRIYDLNDGKTLIMLCGGPTDCSRPPFKRTEAGEMHKLFKQLASRPFVQTVARNWKYIFEKRSISGLENHLYAYAKLKSKGICSGKIYIFCEATRAKRNAVVAKKIFKGFKVQIISIDFDTSSNRYLDKKVINERENKTLKAQMIVLKDRVRLKDFIDLHKQKLSFLRKNYKKNHAKMVEKWWKNNIKNNF